MKQISPEMLKQLDDLAEARKQRILNTPNSYSAEDSENCFYLSPNGNDTANGRTPETAWKSLTKLNNTPFAPGSIIFFERGGLWRGQIQGREGCTYTAYGEGDKPKFYAGKYDGAKEGEWLPTDVPNIYRYSIRMGLDVGCLIFNDGEQEAYKITCKFEGDQPIYDCTFNEEFRSWRDLHHDLAFYHDFGGAYIELRTSGEKLEKYGVLPTLLALDTDFDENSPLLTEDTPGFIYLYSEKGNPAERFQSIEFLPRFCTFNLADNRDIVIDNLCIKYTGGHGVSALNIDGLTVTNCEIGWIGGGLQYIRSGNPTRFGNGVEVYGGCRNYFIQNCYVYQCYDAGITHQYSTGGTDAQTMENVIYNNNLIEDCVYNIEYFMGAADNGANRIMRNILIENNILRYAGRGWGKQRPNAKAYAHIRGGASHQNRARNYRVEHNIMQVSESMMIRSACVTEADTVVYRDNVFIQTEGAEFSDIGVQPTQPNRFTDEAASRPDLMHNTYYKL